VLHEQKEQEISKINRGEKVRGIKKIPHILWQWLRIELMKPSAR
jgi:hypothetical protein